MVPRTFLLGSKRILLVAAALPEAGVAGGPGHVPPVVLAAQLDGVGEAAGPPARRGQARLPGVRSDRQTEVRLSYAAN